MTPVNKRTNAPTPQSGNNEQTEADEQRDTKTSEPVASAPGTTKKSTEELTPNECILHITKPSPNETHYPEIKFDDRELPKLPDAEVKVLQCMMNKNQNPGKEVAAHTEGMKDRGVEDRHFYSHFRRRICHWDLKHPLKKTTTREALAAWLIKECDSSKEDYLVDRQSCVDAIIYACKLGNAKPYLEQNDNINQDFELFVIEYFLKTGRLATFMYDMGDSTSPVHDKKGSRELYTYLNAGRPISPTGVYDHVYWRIKNWDTSNPELLQRLERLTSNDKLAWALHHSVYPYTGNLPRPWSRDSITLPRPSRIRESEIPKCCQHGYVIEPAES